MAVTREQRHCHRALQFIKLALGSHGVQLLPGNAAIMASIITHGKVVNRMLCAAGSVDVEDEAGGRLHTGVLVLAGLC